MREKSRGNDNKYIREEDKGVVKEDRGTFEIEFYVSNIILTTKLFT